MSNIYIQEPPTHGKVLLTTSAGEIEVELWSKEAPLACRNFVQLCLEGYYDSTVFHRVIPGFIAQGGDPLGTGEGGESIYGKPFKDEFHSRLRFVRRGLVAMANSRPNDNGSQFFFTLGQCTELHNKHTIFGKVAGDTLYNLPRFEEGEIGKDERPMYPQKIIKTEVLVNPFTDIVPREAIANEISKEDRKKKKKKGVKNFSLLSFGGEAEEEEALVISATREMGGAGGTEPSLLDPEEVEVIPPPEREGAKERIRAKLMKLTAPEAKDNVSVKFKNKDKKKDPESAPDVPEDTSPSKTEGSDRKYQSVESSSSAGTVDKTTKSAEHDSSLHRRHHSDSHHSHQHHKKDKKKRDRSEERDGKTDRRREKKRRESKEEETDKDGKDKKRSGSQEKEGNIESKDKKRRGSNEEVASGGSKDKKRRGSKEEEADNEGKDKKRRVSKEKEKDNESKDKKRRGSKEEEASIGNKDKKRRGSKDEETDIDGNDKKRRGTKVENVDDNEGNSIKKDDKNIGIDIKESSHIDENESVANEDGNKLGKSTISDGAAVVDNVDNTSSNKNEDKDASSRKQEDSGELDKSEDKKSSGKRRRTSSSDAAARAGVEDDDKKRRQDKDFEERVSHKNGEKRRTSQDVTTSAASVKIDDDGDEKKENVQKLSLEEEAALEKAKKLSEIRAEFRQLKREFTGKDGMKKNKDIEENGKEVKLDKKPSTALQEYKTEKGKYLDKKQGIPKKRSEREDITLALMEKFNNKVKSALTEAEERREKGGLEEEEEDEKEDDWLSHRLVYDTDTPVLARDASTKDDTWYPLDDPRHPLNRQRREEASGGGGGGGKGGTKRGKK